MSFFRILLVCALFAALSLTAVAAEPLPLVNADFHEWKDGLPTGWTVEVGARSGSETPSRLNAHPDGGIELAGDAATDQWRTVSQQVLVPPGSAGLRLKFAAQAQGLKKEERQFNNAYIGLVTFDAGGKRLSMQVRELFEPLLAPGQLVVKLPQSAARADVILFLSKTGSIRVKHVSLEKLAPADSFDVLADELDRYYSFFALKKINWRERMRAYQAVGQSAKTPDAFVAAVKPLLAELKDIHVAIESPEGMAAVPHASKVNMNFNARSVAGKLRGVKQIGRMGFVGRTEEGFGYVAIGTLAADGKTTEEMLAAFDSLLDAKGLIIDLRPNSGGSEPIAQQFVARLVAQPLPYAANQFRVSDKYDELLTLGTRQVMPHEGRRFSGPVVGLIGPGCVSSGEGFALMLAALPGVKLIGQNTRGASGNPQPIVLPNGVTVRYSIWVPLQLDGKPFEGVGIAPDIRVEDDPQGLKGLAKAVAELKASGK